jgi:predicted transcriptional regulator
MASGLDILPGVADRRQSGALEAEVLAALWAADEALTPGEVLERINGGLAYTTVMTTLIRLQDKGVVTRDRVGRAYAYRPVIEEAELAATRMRELLDAGGDREAVLARFVGTLSAAEERTLAALIRAGTQRERRRRG